MAEAAHTFVTGFPRLLPRRVVKSFLARSPDARATLLVREKHVEQAQGFLTSLLPSESARVKVLVGDVANLHLGLSTPEYRELAASVTDVVHAAEWSELSADRPLMVRVNVEGTRGALELAGDCRNLRRFTHMSTVFVAGDRVGVIAEDELASGQSFRNLYEETRFEAELLVRRAMGELPCTVLRPSIVVGDSKSGEIDKFEGPYAIAIVLVTSPVSVPVPLPGDGVAPLNVVPIDWVVQVAEKLHFDARAVGRTFHLVDPNPPSSRRVWELVAHRTGRKLPRMSLGYKLTDTLLKLPGLERLTRDQRMAIAYVNHLSFYSSRNTLELLDGTGLNCPHIESYLDKLIEYVRGEFRRRKE
ncbi:MAG: SDR family oxidoreductase [Deltaproteobacteria bacterium]|nr:SDR family oxidoreductase [Deltaproteobacteria bacterium]